MVAMVAKWAQSATAEVKVPRTLSVAPRTAPAVVAVVDVAWVDVELVTGTRVVEPPPRYAGAS